MNLHKFLAKYNWTKDVTITSSTNMDEALAWLDDNGYEENKDWEIIGPYVNNKGHYWIVFCNDARIATYLKLTWG